MANGSPKALILPEELIPLRKREGTFIVLDKNILDSNIEVS
jgi:hypothetical protein